MSINEEVYAQPAEKRDVGGLAINGAVALFAIADALLAIQGGEKPTDVQIAKIRECATNFAERFNRLSGWVDE
ncbi:MULTISPECIES: hypothetical protein [unclassified Novosphingobium]|uniref:hypothetical protein n=1 Tax=unclassified Novosphingobium TaxID=2644732 RepID=UPI0013570E24|nr:MULTISPECIES: hypothetical protein [unclassified Novosphingobium]